MNRRSLVLLGMLAACAPKARGVDDASPRTSVVPVATAAGAVPDRVEDRDAGSASAPQPKSTSPSFVVSSPAFDLFCVVQRALGEGALEWKVLGCPATLRPLPKHLRPKAIVRARGDAVARARTSLLRVDLGFDDTGRVTKLQRTFEEGRVTTGVFEYDADGRLVTIKNEVNGVASRAGLRGNTISFTTQGDTTTIQGALGPEVLVRGGEGGTFESASSQWTFGPGGGGWRAVRTNRGAGTDTIVLELDAEGRPKKLRHMPAVPMDPTGFEWRDDRLIATSYRDGKEPGESVVY